MGKLNSLDKVLEHELKDIFSAENQILKALPKMVKSCNLSALKDALQTHIKETEKQIERLQKIADMIGIKLTGKVCKGMQGLLEEGREVMEQDSENPALLDLMLIAAAQKVEHYEISAYGTIRTIAEELRLSAVVQLLQQSLDEESAADEKLTQICEEEVMNEASSAEDEEAEESENNQMPLNRNTRRGVTQESPMK